MQVNTVDELISDIRQGRMVVLLDDDADSNNEGVVMVAAEHCDASHVNFMARQARGLVCLALTRERCRQLDLPPMVDDGRGEKSNFTLSIEASEGIDTGISAADRARTVQAAVAPHAVPGDIVQPGHIFPLTAMPGGVLTRAGHTEAAVDLARMAGLAPVGVFEWRRVAFFRRKLAEVRPEIERIDLGGKEFSRPKMNPAETAGVAFGPEPTLVACDDLTGQGGVARYLGLSESR